MTKTLDKIWIQTQVESGAKAQTPGIKKVERLEQIPSNEANILNDTPLKEPGMYDGGSPT